MKNILFHAVVENEIRQSPFGQHTYNFFIKEGIVLLNTMNVVKQRRKRYKLDKSDKL